MESPNLYRDSDLSIKRFDLPSNGPLVLGPGLSIDKIPYYFTQINPGGEGWTVSSPLWGGFKDRSLENGIEDVQQLIIEATRYVWERYDVGRKKGSLDLREIQHNIRGVPDYQWTQMKVPPLIKGMAFAPLMGALVASESRAAGRDLSIYLSEDVFRGDSPFFYEVDRRVVTPALTIDGKATPEKVLELQEKYGKRPVVKFKIGTKGLEEEIAFILDILGNHLPHRPYFILDANQAHSPESCGRVLERLAHAGYLEKLLFLEQPSKVGEEPNGFDTMYAGISPGIRISWDESVASVSDIKRLSERIGGRQAPDVLIVPKFEKLGLVEFVEMFAAADNYGFRVTPSTLTGPPNQWALFAYLAERLPCFTLPGNPRAIPVEANGYEILRWREIAQALSFPTGDRILSEREPILDTCIQHDGIPDVARTVGLDKMPHSLVFRPS